jgi:hypothetical protein
VQNGALKATPAAAQQKTHDPVAMGPHARDPASTPSMTPDTIQIATNEHAATIAADRHPRDLV